jgi:hypothetical protein
MQVSQTRQSGLAYAHSLERNSGRLHRLNLHADSGQPPQALLLSRIFVALHDMLKPSSNHQEITC